MALLEQYSTWSYLIDLIKKHTPPTNLQNLKWRNKNLKLTSTLHSSEDKQIKVQRKIYLYLDGVWLFWIKLKVSWKFWRHPLFPEMPNTHSSCKLLYHPFHWVEWKYFDLAAHIYRKCGFSTNFAAIKSTLTWFSFRSISSAASSPGSASPCPNRRNFVHSPMQVTSKQCFFLYCQLLLDWIGRRVNTEYLCI